MQQADTTAPGEPAGPSVPHLDLRLHADSSISCMIADRSEVGRSVLGLWRDRFDDTRARINEWDLADCGYFANLRLDDQADTTTLMAQSEAELIESTVPLIINRVRTKGAKCTNLLGVEPGLRKKLERAFSAAAPLVNNEGAHYGLGYELYATGAIGGRRMIVAKDETHPASATVMAIDRSAIGLGAMRIIRQRAPWQWGALEEWSQLDASPFAVVIAEDDGVRVRPVPSVRTMLRQALPAVLGPLIAAQTPVRFGLALDKGLLRLIEDNVGQLKQGRMPQLLTFPFAPAPTGEALPMRGLKIANSLAFNQVLGLISYGAASSSIAYVPELGERRQRSVRVLRQDDGSLHYILDLANGDQLGTVVPAGEWALVPEKPPKSTEPQH